MKFELHSKFNPTGDQPRAIQSLTEGVLDGIRTQVLVGVTGSGKTFTMVVSPSKKALTVSGFAFTFF